MAHACHTSYSGDRDQEDRGLKPTQTNSSRDPILKNPSQKQQQQQKTRLVEWLKV
jgi:hypothetical protein